MDTNQQKYKNLTREEAQELHDCGVINFEWADSNGVAWWPWTIGGSGEDRPDKYIWLLYRIPVE